MQNSEPLFFIDYNEAEIFEHEIAGDQSMRANDNVDAPLAQLLQHFLLFGLGTKAAERVDTDRVLEHSLSEHLKMLLSENSRRRQHGGLFAVHDCLERGTHSDFGFAEADIATDQAIHWSRTFHIELRVDDRPHLIRRFPKRE